LTNSLLHRCKGDKCLKDASSCCKLIVLAATSNSDWPPSSYSKKQEITKVMLSKGSKKKETKSRMTPARSLEPMTQPNEVQILVGQPHG